MTENKLAQSTFYYPKISKNWLEKNGFRYNRTLSSSEDGEIYTLRFSVVSWNLYVTVEAEIMYNLTDNIAHINCYDKCTRSLYARWYSYYYGNYTPVVDKINKTVIEKLNKLGMIEKDNNRKSLFDIPKRRNK